MADRKKKVTIGIDLGGTAVKIGIVDEAYELLAQTSIPTGAERPYEQVIADMGMRIDGLQHRVSAWGPEGRGGQLYNQTAKQADELMSPESGR